MTLPQVDNTEQHTIRRTLLVGMYRNWLVASESENESAANVRNNWNFAFWYFLDSETMDRNPGILNPGIPAEFSNPVIPGLVAFNPGIYGIEKLAIKCL